MKISVLLGFLFALASAGVDAKIHRSVAAKAAFQRGHPCPATGLKRGKCPGFIIDHINALACGGPDIPTNMQWQSAVAAKSKDRWERKGCHYR